LNFVLALSDETFLIISHSYARCGKYINKEARIDGKIVIVTGSNCGIGFATVVELAKRGGKIYLACRSEEKALAAIKEIKEQSGSETVFFMKLDLSSLASIREFSKNFHEKESKLDILVNNAGVLTSGSKTEDGFEINMGVNHLGHFLLTNLLLDLLKAAAPSRIVVVSSTLHKIGIIDKENLNAEKSYPGTWPSYAHSKLANILFTKELAKRLEGTGVTVNSLCPGAVDTDVTKNLNFVMRYEINRSYKKVHKMLIFFHRNLMRPIMKLFYATPLKGAQTQIMLAIEPELEKMTGKYFVGCKETEPSDKAKDEDLARWLWDRSAELTGLTKA
jgi:retinol dehydrogenase 12